MNAPTLPARADMTLAGLKAYDFAAAWARLTPEQQTAYGEAQIAAHVARLIEDFVPYKHPDHEVVSAMGQEAGRAAEDLVEAVLTEFPWPSARRRASTSSEKA